MEIDTIVYLHRDAQHQFEKHVKKAQVIAVLAYRGSAQPGAECRHVEGCTPVHSCTTPFT